MQTAFTASPVRCDSRAPGTRFSVPNMPLCCVSVLCLGCSRVQVLPCLSACLVSLRSYISVASKVGLHWCAHSTNSARGGALTSWAWFWGTWEKLRSGEFPRTNTPQCPRSGDARCKVKLTRNWSATLLAVLSVLRLDCEWLLQKG